MALVIDGTNISQRTSISCAILNAYLSEIEKIVCDDVAVWELQKDITLTGPGNATSIGVTGDAWSGWTSAHNGDTSGRVYDIYFTVDMTPYKRIRLRCGVSNASGTTDCRAGYAFYWYNGSNWIYLFEFKSGSGKSYAWDTYLDCASIAGEKTIIVRAQFYGGTSHGVGNSSAGYYVSAIDLLTT